jgi:hypothetical protein
MPRKSSAALSVVRSVVASSPKVPAPPRELDRAAAHLWRAIAEDRPADWWNAGSLRLLRRFCRTAVYAERLHDALDDEPIGSETAVLIFKQVAAANASLGILAAKMRLSPQAMIDGRSAKARERAVGHKPWEL